MAKKKKKTKQTKLKIARLTHSKGLPLPAYQSKEAAGLDLVAAITTNKPIKLKPGARALIPTGLCFQLPKGYEAQIRPRSGLALKHGITVLNTPGTIDSDYRGEVQVILINLGTVTFTVHRGERIAQMVIAPVIQAKIKASKKLIKTKRGTGGFGSTGSSTGKTKTKAKTKSRTRSNTKSTRKSPTAKPARRTSKATPRIAAKSKTRPPVKRKSRAKTKPKTVGQTRHRTGSAASKSRARHRSAKK